MTIQRLRIRLAEFIAGPSFQVVPNHVFDALVGEHCEQVVRMVTQAVDIVPELFGSRYKPERFH